MALAEEKRRKKGDKKGHSKKTNKVTYLAGQTSHSWTPESYLSDGVKTQNRHAITAAPLAYRQNLSKRQHLFWTRNQTKH